MASFLPGCESLNPQLQPRTRDDLRDHGAWGPSMSLLRPDQTWTLDTTQELTCSPCR